MSNKSNDDAEQVLQSAEFYFVKRKFEQMRESLREVRPNERRAFMLSWLERMQENHDAR